MTARGKGECQSSSQSREWQYLWLTIHDFAHQEGVQRVPGLIFEETRGVLKVFLENIACKGEDCHYHVCNLCSEEARFNPLAVDYTREHLLGEGLVQLTSLY